MEPIRRFLPVLEIEVGLQSILQFCVEYLSCNYGDMKDGRIYTDNHAVANWRTRSMMCFIMARSFCDHMANKVVSSVFIYMLYRMNINVYLENYNDLKRYVIIFLIILESTNFVFICLSSIFMCFSISSTMKPRVIVLEIQIFSLFYLCLIFEVSEPEFLNFQSPIYIFSLIIFF